MNDSERIELVIRRAEEDSASAYSQIRALCTSTDAETLFMAMAIFLGNYDPRLPREAYQLIPAKLQILLSIAQAEFGKSRDCKISEAHLAQCTRALDKAYDARRSVICGQRFHEDSGVSKRSFLLGSLAIEVSMGLGEGEIRQSAQHLHRAQGQFEAWFAKRLGVGPKRLLEILQSIPKVQCGPKALPLAERAREVWSRGYVPSSGADALSPFLQLGDELFLEAGEAQEAAVCMEDAVVQPPVQRTEWEAMIDLLSSDSSGVVESGSANAGNLFPLAVLRARRVFIINISACLHRAYMQFEAEAKRDNKFFSGRYQKAVSDYVDCRAWECLTRLFPKESVLRKVIYPDADGPDGFECELDLAVIAPPFLLVIEAKSKQLRFTPYGADLGRFCTDIKANIEDAFDQARRFVRCIDRKGIVPLRERETGRQVTIDGKDFQKVFIVTVALRRLVTLGGQLPVLREMGLFREGRYPWAVSIDDLDAITRFSFSADVFLHFVERRTGLEHDEVIYSGSELDFFGSYLQFGRLRSGLWRRVEAKPDIVMMSPEYHERFSLALLPHGSPLEVDCPVEFCIPRQVREILAFLARRQADSGARCIANALLSMTDQQLFKVVGLIRAIAAHSPSLPSARSSSLEVGGLLVVVTASEEGRRDDVGRILRERAKLEKYRRRFRRCIGLGVQVDLIGLRFVDAMCLDGEWRECATMERHVEESWSRAILYHGAGSARLGRNEPCPCGSGKKFKHCCLNRLR